MRKLSSYIDYSLLRPDATREEIAKLCAEARRYSFCTVCIPPYFVQQAKILLLNSPVKICTVISFPFGYSTVATKVEEAKKAIQDGADELDVVINIAALLSHDLNYLKNDIESVATACNMQDRIMKAIIETAFLSTDQIIQVAGICALAGVNFVKTSTGYASRGATVEDIKILRANLPEKIRIKAAGGIKTVEFAKELIAAGADRIGCSNISKMQEYFENE
jgi:deoxyribose-phosphate aldolase